MVETQRNEDIHGQAGVNWTDRLETRHNDAWLSQRYEKWLLRMIGLGTGYDIRGVG